MPKVGDKEFNCHDDVTINDLLDAELITEEEDMGEWMSNIDLVKHKSQNNTQSYY